MNISNVDQLAILRALLNGKYNKEIIVAKHLVAGVFAEVKKLADEKNASLRYNANPSDEKMLMHLGIGGVLGGALGGIAGGVPGVLLGGAAGLVVGYCSTRIELVFDEKADNYKMLIQS